MTRILIAAEHAVVGREFGGDEKVSCCRPSAILQKAARIELNADEPQSVWWVQLLAEASKQTDRTDALHQVADRRSSSSGHHVEREPPASAARVR